MPPSNPNTTRHTTTPHRVVDQHIHGAPLVHHLFEHALNVLQLRQQICRYAAAAAAVASAGRAEAEAVVFQCIGRMKTRQLLRKAAASQGSHPRPAHLAGVGAHHHGLAAQVHNLLRHLVGCSATAAEARQKHTVIEF